MDHYKITKKSKFWIYVIINKLWIDYYEYLQNNKQMYISTGKYSSVKKNDMVIIYAKQKCKYKSGFTAIVQIKSDQIINSANSDKTRIQIFNDKNLNKFCFQIDTVMFLPKLILLDDIKNHLEKISGTKMNSITKYVLHDFVFNPIDNSIGQSIINRLFDIFEDNSTDNELSDAFTNDSIDTIDTIDTIETISESSNDQESEDEMYNFGNIPIMVILCDEAKDSLSEDDNEINIIYNHLTKCKNCDITDNNSGNVLFKLLSNWKKMEIVFINIESDSDEFLRALKAYHSIKKYFNNQTYEHSIRLINITNNTTIYNGSILIESYFEEN